MLVTRKSTRSYAQRKAGGKGFRLWELSSEGFPVPAWIVLGSDLFRTFREATGIAGRIEELLRKLQDDPGATGAVSAGVHRLIVETALPAALESRIRAAYRELGAGLIAVRSSAADEDSAQHSFAGQLSSFLYVSSEDEAVLRVKEVWASGYSERGLSYRLQNGLPIAGHIEVAVILQEMIDAEKSGVVFTCDPIGGTAERITVNAVFGVGEGLVSGALEGDTYLVERAGLAKVSAEIATKKGRFVRGSNGEGAIEQELPPELAEVPVLSEEELKALCELSFRVEHSYRFPQDIEWGWKDGRFYILQTRPVTTDVKAAEGLLYIWDNSNIVESYGGITLPLTFTFARFVYHQVYVQFCEILLVPAREIRDMDYFLRNMLGSFYGRVYYNILNWYKLTSILPGFKYNRGFMETMMGTAHSLADEIADRIKPPGFQEKFSSKVRRFVTGMKFFWYHLTIQSMVDGFLSYFHRVYDEYRKRDYSRLPADEIFADYQELERRLLRQWHAPIVNDYLTMVHFGLLKKLTGMWLSHLGDSLQNDLLCGNGNLESAEPTRELIRMAAEAEASSEVKALLVNTPAEDCLEALVQAPGQACERFLGRVNRYIDKYGFRCMSEMKLEQTDLHQDPTFLFTCLKNYLRSGQTDLDGYEKREREIREAAEGKVRSNLKGLRRIVFFWSLKHARKAVRNRENTRFCRTRIYGVVRAMFYGIGRDYTLRGIIDQPRDIFYITLQELYGSLEGHLTGQNLRATVEMRKKEYAGYESVEPSSRFMTRGPTYWMNDHSPDDSAPATEDLALEPNQLKGTGCCPGVIEGRVRVILNPEDNMELDGEILVTMRTDPGWIPLYPSISGLLVERGGLLSHSAIVAREMGLPTVVGVKGLIKRIPDGARVRFDGKSGLIEIVEQREEDAPTPVRTEAGAQPEPAV